MLTLKNKQYIHNAIIALQVFSLFVWVITLKDTDSYYSVYLLCAFAGAFSFFDNCKNNRMVSKKKTIVISIASVIFSTLVVLANYALFFPLSSTNILNIPLCLLGGFFAGSQILVFACNVFPFKTDCAQVANKRKHPLRFFLISFGIIAAIDLLYLFFYAYPGALTNDSMRQIEQCLSGDYSNHHPFWHTIIIKGFLELGLFLFNNINTAIALYSIFSLLFIASGFAYAMVTLYQSGIPKKALILIFAVFAFMPYNIAYSVTMWKDVVFGCAALLFVVSLVRVFRNIGKHTVINYVILALSGLAFCLWRSNGGYAFIVAAVVFAVVLRKTHIKVTLIMAGVIILSLVLQGPVLSALNVKKTSFSEQLSIPLQQIARVVSAGCDLTEDEEAQLSKIMDLDRIPELYTEYISDPVKGHVAEIGDEYLQEHKLDYLKLWIKLGLKYPQHYAAAYIEQTKGYWNGGYEYFWYSANVESNDLGITKEADGITRMLFAPYFFVFETQSFTEPVKSIGLHVWLLAGACLIAILGRRKEEALLALPMLFVVATLLIATPVFSSFRYAYGVFTTLPFILGVTLFKCGDCKKVIVKEGEKGNE